MINGFTPLLCRLVGSLSSQLGSLQPTLKIPKYWMTVCSFYSTRAYKLAYLPGIRSKVNRYIFDQARQYLIGREVDIGVWYVGMGR